MNNSKSHNKFNVRFLAIILAVLMISLLFEIINYQRFHTTAHILEWFGIGVLLLFDAWNILIKNRIAAILIAVLAVASFINAFYHPLYFSIIVVIGLILAAVYNYRLFLKPIIEE